MASPHLQMVLDLLRRRESDRAGRTLTIELLREGLESAARALPPPIGMQARAAGTNVPAEWVRMPVSDARRAVLYFHGGGYALGSVGTHRHLMGRLADAAGALVLGVDYRRAPEHPFPAALEDALAAYEWLLKEGFAPERVAVAGDSAGGGLALATLIAARDGGLPLPAAAVCFSPWVDLEALGESMTTNAACDPMVDRAGLLQMAELYLAGTDPRHPLAAPLHAELGGLPPLLLQVGTAETLLDDAIRFAARAEAAGVDVTLEQWEEMPHVWQFFAGLLPEGREALEKAGAFIQGRTGASGKIHAAS